MGVEIHFYQFFDCIFMSCPARGMGVEIASGASAAGASSVMPREGHGSRNTSSFKPAETEVLVMPREGHGSRNTLSP